MVYIDPCYSSFFDIASVLNLLGSVNTGWPLTWRLLATPIARHVRNYFVVQLVLGPRADFRAAVIYPLMASGSQFMRGRTGSQRQIALGAARPKKRRSSQTETLLKVTKASRLGHNHQC